MENTEEKSVEMSNDKKNMEHQLIELIKEICMALDNRELICLILCDVRKAFDRVWLRGLLLKLERYGIKGQVSNPLEICYLSATC
jgi:hypothetical protein